jgi:hypothetical protein
MILTGGSMSKSKKRFADTANQPSIFDLLVREQKSDASIPAEGSANVRDGLRAALVEALKHPAKSRWQIAGEMSHLTGTEISKYQIDAWVAESKEHRIPAEYVPALCRVTESYEPLRVLTEAAGVYLMKSEEALRAEIQKWDEEARKAQGEKKRREALLKNYAHARRDEE